MGSAFSINNYLNEEEKAVLEDGQKAEQETTKREIQIVPIGDMKGSEIVANALIEALRQDKLNFTETKITDNDIYKQVKIVTLQDISSSFANSLAFVKNADIVLLETAGELLTDEAGQFLDYLDSDKQEIFYSHKDVVERLRSESKPALQVQEVHVPVRLNTGSVVVLSEDDNDSRTSRTTYILEGYTEYNGNDLAVLRSTTVNDKLILVQAHEIETVGV